MDWDEVTGKLAKLETDCKASWDQLRAVVKHDMAPSLKSKCVLPATHDSHSQSPLSSWLIDSWLPRAGVHNHTHAHTRTPV